MIDIRSHEPGGSPMLATPDPVNPQLKFFTGFNPASVAPAFRDILRYLFHTSAPDVVKYRGDADTRIDIRTKDDMEADTPAGMRPVILVSRGGYSVQASGLNDGGAEYGYNKGGQQDTTSYLAFVNGVATIRIIAWDYGVAELMGLLAMQYLVATRPYLCNTQGFHALGGVGVSPPLLDKDDKNKWVIDIQQPYTLEMKWRVTDIGTTVRGILLTTIAEQ